MIINDRELNLWRVIVIRALNPIVSIIRPLPALSWIPLSMLWLGIDEQQKYAIVFMGSFASVLVDLRHLR